MALEGLNLLTFCFLVFCFVISLFICHLDIKYNSNKQKRNNNKGMFSLRPIRYERYQRNSRVILRKSKHLTSKIKHDKVLFLNLQMSLCNFKGV